MDRSNPLIDNVSVNMPSALLTWQSKGKHCIMCVCVCWAAQINPNGCRSHYKTAYPSLRSPCCVTTALFITRLGKSEELIDQSQRALSVCTVSNTLSLHLHFFTVLFISLLTIWTKSLKVPFKKTNIKHILNLFFLEVIFHSVQSYLGFKFRIIT